MSWSDMELQKTKFTNVHISALMAHSGIYDIGLLATIMTYLDLHSKRMCVSFGVAM